MAFVSAGAFAREIDLSLFVETNSNTSCAAAHVFNKGPIGVPTLITNINRLLEVFGEPIDPSVDASGCQGWFGLREYLRNGNKAWVTRVDSAANPAAYAAQSIQGGTDETLITAADGVTSIPATRTLTSGGSNFVTAGVVAGDILEIADSGTPGDNGYYIVTIVAATVLTVNRDFPTGSLAALDFTVHIAKREAAAQGATSTSSGRQFTSAGRFFTTNVRVGDLLDIGDANSPGDNGVYLITKVVSNTVLEIDRDWPLGDLTALTYAIYGHNSIGADGSTAVDGTFSSASAKFVKHFVKAGDILWIKDAVDTGNNGYFMITGTTSETAVTVNLAEWEGGSLTALSYEILPGSITFQGESKGSWARGLEILGKANSLVSTNFNFQANNGDIVADSVNSLNRANVVTQIADNSALFTAIVRTLRREPVIGKSFTVSGGVDGSEGVTDSDFIGNSLLKTGLKSFRNKEAIEFDIAIVPGQSSQNIQDEIIELCTKRGDAIGIVDPPDFPTVESVQEVLDFSNGSLVRTTALNSSYGALYWPWVQVFDEFHNLDVWTAPSGHMAGVYTQNDNQQFPWFAPAGLKRGKLRGATDLRVSPDQDDRDALNGPGANVNPITNFVGFGIHAFGQKTLQRANTALNRVNVRRMLTFTKRAIEKAARNLVFDPNDPILWREFKQVVEPSLKFVLTNRGINEFLIIADETTTTAQVQEQNKMVSKIFIKPTLTAEIIDMQFVITSQGANFAELAA